jgi:hypothetical protein
MGVSLPGERWTISTTGLGRFLAELHAPMTLARSDSTTATRSPACTATRPTFDVDNGPVTNG